MTNDLKGDKSKEANLFLVGFGTSEQDINVISKLITSSNEISDQQMNVKVINQDYNQNSELHYTLSQDPSFIDGRNEKYNTLEEKYKELIEINNRLTRTNESLKAENNKLKESNRELLSKYQELAKEDPLDTNSETFLRAIAENIPNGTVGIINENLKVEFLAGKGLESYDFSSEDVMGKNIIDVNPSEYERKRITDLFIDTLNGKHGSIDVVYKDRHFILRTVPLFEKHDSKKRFMYLSQEITQQKKKSIKLDIAIDSANLLIYEWDAKNDTFDKNRVLNNFLGLKEDTLLTGEMYMNQILEEDHEHIVKQWEIAKKSGILEYEARMNTKKGLRWIRAKGKVIFDRENQAERVIVSVFDITSDKLMLEHLKSQEQQFRVISNTVPALIWLTNSKMEIIYQNDNWYDITGVSSEDYLGDGWRKYLHPEDRNRVLKVFREAINTHDPFNIEYRIQNSNGEYSWFLNNAKPIFEENGDFKGYIGSCIDITEKRKFTDMLEKKVEQRTKELHHSNEQLIKVNMNLEEYAYMASHDLQEPIRKIRTFNSIISENAKNEEIIEYSRKIEKSAYRMTSLVKNILEYSKLNDSTIEKESLNLNVIVENVKDELELLIKEKGATINSIDLGHIKGIGLQINQLIGNLLKNSLKFSSELPPIITISSSIVSSDILMNRFEAKPNSQYLKLTIADNGIGIKDDFKDLVFKPFKRLNPKHKYSGTGIGLAICKKIVELHHGHIEIDNTYSDGSAFNVYFPKDQN